jgi:hypothetical protein
MGLLKAGVARRQPLSYPSLPCAIRQHQIEKLDELRRFDAHPIQQIPRRSWRLDAVQSLISGWSSPSLSSHLEFRQDYDHNQYPTRSFMPHRLALNFLRLAKSVLE